MTTNITLSSPVERGDVGLLAPHVLSWVADCVDLCKPKNIHIMDGSPQEDRELKVGRIEFISIKNSCVRQCW